MTKLKLKVEERLGITRMFNKIHAMKGLDIVGLRRAGKIGEMCELSKEEKKEINWIDLSNGNANINLEKAQTLEKEIELGSNEITMIKEAITRMNETKEFANADTFVLTLCEKIGLKFE